MRVFFILLITIFIIPQTFGQHIDTITFNNYINSTDNDLVNNFTNISNFYQTTTGGITGGCLNVTNNFSNSIARSKNKVFIFRAQDTLEVSARFYFRGDTVSVSDVNSALGFRLHPYSISTSNFDFSKFVEFGVDKSNPSTKDALFFGDDLGSAHSYINSPYLLGINKWYEVKVKIYKLPSSTKFISDGNIIQLSNDGTTSMGVWRSCTGDIIDNADVYNSDTYTFSLKARYYEGVKKIDQIIVKSGEYPLTTSEIKISENAPLLMNTLVLKDLHLLDYSNIQQMTIFNLFGQKLYQQQINSNTINIEFLHSGMYLCVLKYDNKYYTYKFLKY